MTKSKYWLLYAVLFGVTYLAVYDFFTPKHMAVPEKDILKLDTKPFQEMTADYTGVKHYGTLWGIEGEDTELVHTPGKKGTKNQTFKAAKVTMKKEEICINKTCFRLLATVKKNEEYYAVFYGKSFPKNHIRLLHPHSILHAGIEISVINDREVVLSELPTKRSWPFLLFDVNTTKYKPKDINETHF